jgi:predicted alpha/beta superfamily hydrolase
VDVATDRWAVSTEIREGEPHGGERPDRSPGRTASEAGQRSAADRSHASRPPWSSEGRVSCMSANARTWKDWPSAAKQERSVAEPNGSTRRRITLVSWVFLFAWTGAQAQLLTGKSDSVYSNVLKQNRPVEVYLPKEFETEPAQRYETLYVLDGDWNTKIVVDIVNFMRQVGFMPPVIVVGVPNVIDEHGNTRDHDFTPTVVVADRPQLGGAADFLSFLKTELVPYIDQHYPTNQVHLVHGHSLGGLFLMYALLHEPALFDGYVILDPAMWWDKHSLDAVIDQKLADLPTKGKAIYIAAREGHAFEGMGVSTIKPIFERRASSDLHWQITTYANESHDSLKLKGTYDALKFVYQGYRAGPDNLFPTGGIVIKGKPVFLSVDVDDDFYDLHYSTDGSEPNAASPKIDGTLTVSDPEKTQIKLLSNRGIFDRAIPHGLKSGTVLPPSRTAKGTDTWHVSFYPASAWTRLRRSKAFKTFDTDKDMRFADAGRDTFAGSVERNLDIPSEGYYVFAVLSNDKVHLSVAGRPLIDNDGARGHSKQAFIVRLQRGVYPIGLQFQRAVNTEDVSMIVFQCKDGEPEWWKNTLFEVSSRQ